MRLEWKAPHQIRGGIGFRSGLLVFRPFLLVQSPRERFFLVLVPRTKPGTGGALPAEALSKAADQPTCFLTSGSASPDSVFGSSRSITRYCYLDGATWFLFNGGSLKKSQRLETRAVSNIQRQVNLFYFSFISLTEERFLFPYKSSNRQRVKVTNNRSYDLRRRSSVASYWPAPLCFRRSRCRSAVSSGDRCNPYGT